MFLEKGNYIDRNNVELFSHSQIEKKENSKKFKKFLTNVEVMGG